MTATHASNSLLDSLFVQQAKALVAGGELLPASIELLAQRLQESAQTGTPLKIKLGLDPTRPDLHLGHSVVLRKLRMFQDLGHEAILIIGDATAMIGDPSGRNQTRPPLTEEEVLANANTYLEQASQVIDLDKATLVRNSQWLNTLDLPAMIKLAAKITVAQLLVREDFSTRLKAGTPISFHELLYPLMQGYDSVMVNADVELGGTDQRFNNLMGRELQQQYGHPSQQLVLLMPLLEGTDGVVKMSKSYPEHCINLTDAPQDMLGKLMSIPDTMINRYYQLLASVPAEQLAQQAQLMASGEVNPRDLKMNLAQYVVGQYHGADEALQAAEQFTQQFRNKQLPADMPELTVVAGYPYEVVALLLEQQLVASKAEARRLIEGGGVRVHWPSPDDEVLVRKVESPEETLQVAAGQWLVLQAGKRRYIRLIA